MNKTDLVAVLEARLGSRRAATDAVEGFIEAVQDAVAQGQRVTLSGFGTFELVVRNARVGRNLRTGEAVEIPATRLPRFRPGTAFRVQVAGSESAEAAPASATPAINGQRVAKAPVSAVRPPRADAVTVPAAPAAKIAKKEPKAAKKVAKKPAAKKGSKK